jgi:hypothetical protein
MQLSGKGCRSGGAGMRLIVICRFNEVRFTWENIIERSAFYMKLAKLRIAGRGPSGINSDLSANSEPLL